MKGADYALVVAYFAVTIALGLYFARRWKGSEDFFLAGRSLTWPIIGLSLFATNISTEHFVGLAAGGYSEGLVQGGYEWIASYCLIVLAAVFAPQYLKHRVFTIPEFFEKRFGVETRVLLTVYFLAMIVLTKTSVALFTGTRVLADLTGWNFQAIIWTLGIVTAFYTMAGGLAAVVYTDALQAIILIGGSVLLTVFALIEVGGVDGLVQGIQAVPALNGHLSMIKGPESDLPFTGFLLGNFLTGGMFYWCMDQVNVQRVLGARDVRQARLGAIFAGFLKIIPVFILVLPGVIAAVLWRDIDDANKTYSRLVQELLPSGAKGLVLAALLAALMSSISSMFNSASTLVARDLVFRFNPRVTAPTQILIGQFALLGVMVGGILVSPLIGRYKHVWGYLQDVTGYLSVPFAVVGLAGVFSRRVNRAGALAGVAVGVVSGILLFWDQHREVFGFLRHQYLNSFLHRIFLSSVLSFLAMVVVSLLTPPPPEKVRRGAFRFSLGAGTGESSRDRRLALAWMAVLFATVTALWVIFR